MIKEHIMDKYRIGERIIKITEQIKKIENRGNPVNKWFFTDLSLLWISKNENDIKYNSQCKESFVVNTFAVLSLSIHLP